MPPDRSAGFTLLELLIAIALLGLLTTGLVGALRQGFRLAGLADARHAALLDAALARDVLQRQLGQVRPLMATGGSPRRGAAFEGTPDYLAFAAARPVELGGGQQWLVLELEETPAGRRLVLRHATSESDLGPRRPDTGDRPTVSPLIDGIAALRITYLSRGSLLERPAWFTNWSQRRESPALIRIDLDYAGRRRARWEPLLIRPMPDAPPRDN